MKTTIALTLAALLTSPAFAVYHPEYENNLVMVCGDIWIFSEEYTTKNRGFLSAPEDMAQVYAVKEGQSVTLLRSADAERTWLGLGKAEGVGLFESDEYRLDLRKSRVQKEIDLEDLTSGKKLTCSVWGDCC